MRWVKRVCGGFTLVDMLVVAGLVLFISVPAIYGVFNIRANHSLAAATEQFENVVKLANVYSRDGRSESAWVLRIANDRDYGLWSRSGLVPDVLDSSFRLADMVRFEGIASYPHEILFQRGTGSTGFSQTVSLRAANGSLSQVVINQRGLVEVL